MTFIERITRSKFFIKLTNWEYWPFGILQAPFFLYWIWLSIKARSFFFFSASNPSIYSGGMLGESKKEALDLVPDEYRPKTILVRLPTTINQVLSAINEVGLKLPVIFKPDIGERGFMVRKIRNQTEIEKYLNEVPTDFLIQEFLDLPLEFGVFYVRKPSDSTGKVVSINSKEMLTVTGNGKDTLAELVYKNGRAHLQGGRLQKIFAHQWNSIVPPNETIELNSIGNHCLGTKFMNGNNLITPTLNDSFDMLSKRVKGFYFGRYDLRCASLADLENGNVKIMELNGCGAEPAHIYQPGFSFWQALKVMYNHWRLLYEISVENHKRGVPYVTFAEARKTYLRTKKIFSKRTAL
jgi:hypothetical protein